MNARRIKAFLRPATAIISLYAILLAGCGPRQSGPGTAAITLSGIPASRLYFRYEADVPAPQLPGETLPADRDAGILADFQTNRPADELVRTLASPDNRRILAVYRREGDAAEEFRLDMYTKEGKLLRPVTPDNLAVHFQEIIRWAPDSSAVAFVATLREVAVSPTPVPLPSPAEEPSPNETPADETSPTPQSSPTPNLPPVMAFRTEQIYLCDSEAADLRPLTRNEGFIYYYFVWSPDSTMLAAMATHSREWQELERKADEAGMLMTPLGRPRIIERTGPKDGSMTDLHRFALSGLRIQQKSQLHSIHRYASTTLPAITRHRPLSRCAMSSSSLPKHLTMPRQPTSMRQIPAQLPMQLRSRQRSRIQTRLFPLIRSSRLHGRHRMSYISKLLTSSK